MTPFEQASALAPDGHGNFTATIPDQWQQGRGAFGGLVLGTLARAMLRTEEDATRLLRALNGEVCGPVMPGLAQITVRVLRRGKGLSTVEAWLDQGGDILARASAIMASRRQSAADVPHIAPAPPTQPAWATVAVAPIVPPLAPVFAQHYEYRPVGPYPFGGGTEALASGYIRELSTQAALDAPAVLAYLDGYWPAYFALLTAPRPAATVAFTAEITADLTALAPDQPLFHIGRVASQRDGFMVEMRELWSGSTLVALNQQTFTLI